jgi:capsular exopolysaccharide synthesis family protein
MSKYFNETIKANDRALKNLTDDQMDVKEVLESLKRLSSAEARAEDGQFQNCSMVQVGNGARVIVDQSNASKAALEAYRQLRTRLIRLQAKTGLKSIAITSSIPGEGKSLTTMNLGLCYAHLPEERVLIIDADLRTGGLTSLLEKANGPGLAEVLAGTAMPDEAIVSTSQKNLYVLRAGGVSTSPLELFSGPKWQALIEHCGGMFKVILVDTPPMLPLVDFEVISAACEGVVVVVRAHYGRRETLQQTSSSLDPKRLLGVVFNAAEVRRSDYSSYPNKYGNS